MAEIRRRQLDYLETIQKPVWYQPKKPTYFFMQDRGLGVRNFKEDWEKLTKEERQVIGST